MDNEVSIATIDCGPATEVQISAPVVIAAHGSWEIGKLATERHVAAPRPGDWLAFKAHFRHADLLAGMMPLLSFPGGYGGMVQCDEGRVSISCCVRRDALARELTLPDRKRLEMARGLATRPELLLLDEVMSGLNPTEIEAIIGLIRRIHAQGVSLLIIEHVMRAIMALSQRIVVLHHGEKIAEGEPAAVARDRRVVEAYLGEESS